MADRDIVSNRTAYFKAYEKAYRPIRRKRYAERREEEHARSKRSYEKHIDARRATHNAYGRTSRGRFIKMKSRAKLREIIVDITFEEYCNIVKDGVCCYCKEKLPEAGHGLDRKNSALGYSAKNCVPACARCNHVRGEDEISYEEMFAVMKLLKRLRRKKNA